MLKIPTAGDRPPPLVVPLRTPPREEVTVEAVSMTDGRRRKRKSRKGEDHSWDRSSGQARQSHRREKKQMIWWLAGGSALFVSILGAVLLAMNSKPGSSSTTEVPPPVPPQAQTSPVAKVAAPVSTDLGDNEFTLQAEPLARKFLEAKSINELLPLVRNPLVAEGRMKTAYPDGNVTPVGLSQFNPNQEIGRNRSHYSTKVVDKEFNTRDMFFFPTPEGLKIDWESWVAWSDVPWEKFLADKPQKAETFRVVLSKVDYYNADFKDEEKWRSYQLLSPDGGKTIYGYVPRDSELDGRLRPPPDVESASPTLKLRFPADSRAGNQVLIEEKVSDSWVIETEPPP
jgi:hypothetical protein